MSQVLLLNRGERNRIAENLVITTNTVKRHLKAIFEKLDVHTLQPRPPGIPGSTSCWAINVGFPLVRWEAGCTAGRQR